MGFADAYEKFTERFSLKRNEPMKNHTSFKVGGNADLFAEPCSVGLLRQLIEYAENYGIPITFIGSGTNILVKDKGIRGLVICLEGLKDTIKIAGFEGNDRDCVIVRASAGVLLSRLGRFAVENGLQGLNFTAGIPGTIGGAVMMNSSSAYGRISDVISSVKFMMPDGQIEIMEKEDIEFSRGGLSFSNNKTGAGSKPLIIEAFFRLKRGDKNTLTAEWENILKARKKTQPVSLPSAGCFFKNPEQGKPAGKLIDMANFKGERQGNAMVSETHANFIVNLGDAKAEDILILKKRIEERVFELFSIHLEPEVRIEGE